MVDGNATGDVVGEGGGVLRSDGIGVEGARGTQEPVRSAVSELGVEQGEQQRAREAQHSVMTEGGEGGSKAGQRQVGEGNEWTEVEGRRRRKRRGTGEPGVPHIQGKRHAGA